MVSVGMTADSVMVTYRNRTATAIQLVENARFIIEHALFCTEHEYINQKVTESKQKVSNVHPDRRKGKSLSTSPLAVTRHFKSLRDHRSSRALYI